jgi:O-antigen/teichoic acid export membrane protein
MVFLSLCILIVTALILSIVLLTFGEVFLELFDGGRIDNYRMLIPIGVLLLGIYNIMKQWALRERNFKNIGKTKLTQSISGNLMKIVLGVAGIGPLGLIVGQIASHSAGILTLGKSLIMEKKHLLKSVSYKGMMRGPKRYYHFPLYNGPAKFISALSTKIPVFFIASLYGGHVLGLYGLANGVIRMPMALIGSSVANVFYGEIASLGKSNPEKIKELTKKLQAKLILIGSIPLVTLLLFGPLLFSFVFGEEWYQAGEFARLLSLLVFFNFTTSPISNVATVFEKMKESLGLSVFRLVLASGVFLAAKIFSLSSYFAIGLYSLAMSINYIAIYLFAQWVIDNAIKEKEATS